MKRPEMILFDYGHTLYDEVKFDVLKGSKAVLKLATKNPEQVTAEMLAVKTEEMNDNIGRYKEAHVRDYLVEFHNIPFTRYLYEYFNLTFDMPLTEVETVFWDSAAPGVPTKHINELLAYLKKTGIRTAVISNLSFGGEALVKRIGQGIHTEQFEFILSTAEYLFRKPNPMIFDFALKKAGLSEKQVWYCGDNVYCDVEGANRVGIQPVWYKGANATGVYNGIMGREIIPQVPNCDHLVVNDWLEMIDLLESL